MKVRMQHLCQDFPVQFGVIDNQDLLLDVFLIFQFLALLAGFLFRSGCHHHVFAVFRLIHQLVRPGCRVLH